MNIITTKKIKKKGRPKKSHIKPEKQLFQKPEIIIKFPFGKKDLDENIEFNKVANIPNNESRVLCSKYDKTKIDALKKELEIKNKSIIQIQKEVAELSNTINTYLGEKKTFIEQKTHIIHKDGKISVIEKNNDIVCYYCTESFTNDPCFIPDKYDKASKTYYVFGNFCSYSCASKYNIDLGDYNLWNRNSLLTSMFRDSAKLSGISDYCSLLIPNCPPKESLIKFGGYMTIEEFRRQSLNGDRQYQYIHPGMEIKKSYIEDIHKKPEIFDSLTTIKNRLKSILPTNEK